MEKKLKVDDEDELNDFNSSDKELLDHSGSSFDDDDKLNAH
jgi:hypothetical protein